MYNGGGSGSAYDGDDIPYDPLTEFNESERYRLNNDPFTHIYGEHSLDRMRDEYGYDSSGPLPESYMHSEGEDDDHDGDISAMLVDDDESRLDKGKEKEIELDDAMYSFEQFEQNRAERDLFQEILGDSEFDGIAEYDSEGPLPEIFRENAAEDIVAPPAAAANAEDDQYADMRYVFDGEADHWVVGFGYPEDYRDTPIEQRIDLGDNWAHEMTEEIGSTEAIARMMEWVREENTFYNLGQVRAPAVTYNSGDIIPERIGEDNRRIIRTLYYVRSYFEEDNAPITFNASGMTIGEIAATLYPHFEKYTFFLQGYTGVSSAGGRIINARATFTNIERLLSGEPEGDEHVGSDMHHLICLGAVTIFAYQRISVNNPDPYYMREMTEGWNTLIARLHDEIEGWDQDGEGYIDEEWKAAYRASVISVDEERRNMAMLNEGNIGFPFDANYLRETLVTDFSNVENLEKRRLFSEMDRNRWISGMYHDSIIIAEEIYEHIASEHIRLEMGDIMYQSIINASRIALDDIGELGIYDSIENPLENATMYYLTVMARAHVIQSVPIALEAFRHTATTAGYLTLWILRRVTRLMAEDEEDLIMEATNIAVSSIQRGTMAIDDALDRRLILFTSRIQREVDNEYIDDRYLPPVYQAMEEAEMRAAGSNREVFELVANIQYDDIFNDSRNIFARIRTARELIGTIIPTFIEDINLARNVLQYSINEYVERGIKKPEPAPKKKTRAEILLEKRLYMREKRAAAKLEKEKKAAELARDNIAKAKRAERRKKSVKKSNTPAKRDAIPRAVKASERLASLSRRESIKRAVQTVERVMPSRKLKQQSIYYKPRESATGTITRPSSSSSSSSSSSTSSSAPSSSALRSATYNMRLRSGDRRSRLKQVADKRTRTIVPVSSIADREDIAQYGPEPEQEEEESDEEFEKRMNSWRARMPPDAKRKRRKRNEQYGKGFEELCVLIKRGRRCIIPDTASGKCYFDALYLAIKHYTETSEEKLEEVDRAIKYELYMLAHRMKTRKGKGGASMSRLRKSGVSARRMRDMSKVFEPLGYTIHTVNFRYELNGAFRRDIVPRDTVPNTLPIYLTTIDVDGNITEKNGCQHWIAISPSLILKRGRFSGMSSEDTAAEVEIETIGHMDNMKKCKVTFREAIEFELKNAMSKEIYDKNGDKLKAIMEDRSAGSLTMDKKWEQDDQGNDLENYVILVADIETVPLAIKEDGSVSQDRIHCDYRIPEAGERGKAIQQVLMRDVDAKEKPLVGVQVPVLIGSYEINLKKGSELLFKDCPEDGGKEYLGENGLIGEFVCKSGAGSCIESWLEFLFTKYVDMRTVYIYFFNGKKFDAIIVRQSLRKYIILKQLDVKRGLLSLTLSQRGKEKGVKIVLHCALAQTDKSLSENCISFNLPKDIRKIELEEGKEITTMTFENYMADYFIEYLMHDCLALAGIMFYLNARCDTLLDEVSSQRPKILSLLTFEGAVRKLFFMQYQTENIHIVQTHALRTVLKSCLQGGHVNNATRLYELEGMSDVIESFNKPRPQRKEDYDFRIAMFKYYKEKDLGLIPLDVTSLYTKVMSFYRLPFGNPRYLNAMEATIWYAAQDPMKPSHYAIMEITGLTPTRRTVPAIFPIMAYKAEDGSLIYSNEGTEDCRRRVGNLKEHHCIYKSNIELHIYEHCAEAKFIITGAMVYDLMGDDYMRFSNDFWEKRKACKEKGDDLGQNTMKKGANSAFGSTAMGDITKTSKIVNLDSDGKYKMPPKTADETFNGNMSYVLRNNQACIHMNASIGDTYKSRSPIQIAAAILSCARHYMFMHILKGAFPTRAEYRSALSGLHYMDTDSFYCDKNVFAAEGMKQFMGEELGQFKHDYGKGIVGRFFSPGPKVKDIFMLEDNGDIVYKSSFKGFRAGPEVMEPCMREMEVTGGCSSRMTIWRRSFDFISTREGQYQVNGIRNMLRNQGVVHFATKEMYIQRHLPWGPVQPGEDFRMASNARFVKTQFRRIPAEARLAAYGHKIWIREMAEAKEDLLASIQGEPLEGRPTLASFSLPLAPHPIPPPTDTPLQL